MAQPQGALLYYAATHGRLGTIAREQSLIIDPGARPFDWLVARGMRKRSAVPQLIAARG